MTPPDNTPQVEVTQADREAAASAGMLVGRYVAIENAQMRLGELDNDPLVQAFAKHRLAATPPAQTALVEALEGLSAEVRLLRMAVQADDPKREIMLRVGDIDVATRAALSLATGERS